MTEEEWAECGNGPLMLSLVGRGVSDRKLRLLACACVRLALSAASPRARLWAEQARRAVEAAELYADGLAGVGVLTRACHALGRCLEGQGVEVSGLAAAAYFASSPTRPFRRDCATAVGYACVCGGRHALRRQPDLIRDLFGWPGRPPTVAPAWLAWRGAAVRGLAEAAYARRVPPLGTLDSERLLVLADALEEAGCGAGGLLSHLRSPGPHVRGCFVVDALLGRG